MTDIHDTHFLFSILKSILNKARVYAHMHHAVVHCISANIAKERHFVPEGERYVSDRV